MTTATVSVPEPASRPAWQQLRSFLFEELKPAPGRMRAALLRVAGVVLGMWAGYGLNLPEVNAIVALAFFASSADRDETKKVALGVPPAVVIIYLFVTLVLHVFGTTPFVRTISFIIIVFASLYLLHAAQEGQVFLLAGVFGKLFLELWDSGYPGALTQELSFWIMINLGVAGLCALLVSTLFGKRSIDPAKKFHADLGGRFELIARFISAPAGGAESDVKKLRAAAFAEKDDLLASLDKAAKKSSALKTRRELFADLIRIHQLLLHECVVLQTQSGETWQQSAAAREWSADRCHAIAHMARSGSLLASPSEAPQVNDNAFAAKLVNTVRLAEQIAAGRARLPEDAVAKKTGFLRPDATTNPRYLTNASRAFAAAFACYCLVSGAKWSGIGTAITTCLITSLTTVEQSRQKQSLRIAGAAVGAILTLFVMTVLIPAGMGLIGFSIVTGLITFIGAWIFAGGPNLNYAGVQLALCYFLSAFGENKTPTSLTSIRDRVIGIFIGNLAMWLFYDRIRPAWTVDSARCAFADEVESIARLVDEHNRQPAQPRQLVKAFRLEREAFARAQVSLKAMSDTQSPAFSPWGRAQQRDAPAIEHAESQLSSLFSLAFVEAAEGVLPLPEGERQHRTENSAKTLFTLASSLREGKVIHGEDIIPPSAAAPDTGALTRGARNALARLFKSDASSQACMDS